MPDECEYSRSKKQGALKMDLEYKMTILSKTAQTILIKIQWFGEIISLHETD